LELSRVLGIRQLFPVVPEVTANIHGSWLVKTLFSPLAIRSLKKITITVTVYSQIGSGRNNKEGTSAVCKSSSNDQ